MKGYSESRRAVYFWEQGRKDSINDSVFKLLPFVFYTLDSLYDITRKLPNREPTFDGEIPIIDAQRFFVLGLPEDEDYKNVRLTLALVSDLYFLLEGIKNQGNLMEIKSVIIKMNDESRKFSDIRNFFTHLDERISNLERHGIDGETITNCGIRYNSTAKNCFHLVVGKGEIHFSDSKEPKEIDIGKSAFNSIFIEARNLYATLTDLNTLNVKADFVSPDTLYPL